MFKTKQKNNVVSFEIFFEHLTEDAQEYLCEIWETTQTDENWDSQPIAIIEREMEAE